MQFDKQQWIVVKSKGKRKLIEKEIKPQRIHFKGGNILFDQSLNTTLQQQFIHHQHTILNLSTIKTFITNALYKQFHVIGLGIGNFCSYLKPQLQMQFMKYCIIQQLKSARILFTINIYDPIFTQEQKQYISRLQATSNQFKSLKQNITHIVYMPHCDRFLYQDLCKYFSQTKNCEVIVIGNSINQYKQRCLLTNSQIPQAFAEINPKDIKIFDYKQAFNDTFIYKL